MFDSSINTIAVVGASARAAAFSLLRAGYQVVCADLFADADLARHCQVQVIEEYPDDFETWLQKIDCDSWIYTGALENHPEFIERISESFPLLGTAAEALPRVRDPMILQQVLGKHGYHFPETSQIREITLSEEWIGKTYAGSSGSEVGLADNATYCQSFIKGTPLSAVYFEEELLGVTEQLVGESWTGAAKFQYCGSIGPWPHLDQFRDELQSLGRMLCKEFGLRGWFGIDLIWAVEKLWVIEINPRYTASIEIVERSLESKASCFGKAILFAKSDFEVTSELNKKWLQQANSISWPDLADIPYAGTKIDIRLPVLTVFSESSSVEQVRSDLKQRVSAIEQEIDNQQPIGAAICD